MKKLLLVVFAGLLLSACSGTTYKMKSEKGKFVNEVPKWYMADFSEKKACNTPRFGKDKDRMCIFGVGTAVSPDLQLAIEKGMMIAKSELADIIKGEMNKSTKQFITELGKTHTKTTVSEVEMTIINLIKDTPVRGYEIFAQEVTRTKNGYYRAWIGLRLPLGEFNKMYDYTIQEVVDSHKIKLKAAEAFKSVEDTAKKKKEGNNE